MGGQLAEEAGESTPYAMQYLLDRAVGAVPRNYGKNTTLIASLSLAGMGEALLLEGAADACAFEVYMEQVLTANKQISSLPRLQEGMQERPGCSPDAVARF